MFKKLKSIRAKFLLQYGILIAFSIVLMIVMLFFAGNIKHYYEMKNSTQNLKVSILEMKKAEKDFELFDLTNEDFYRDGTSENIESISTNKLLTKQIIQLLKSDPEINSNLLIKHQLDQLTELLREYNISFNKLKEIHINKGFKDWGLEGKLREAIHKIEKGKLTYNKLIMLSLRRNEKDFFLRKDSEYIKKFDDLILEFKQTISSKNKDDDLRSLINAYQYYFHQIYLKEQEIGLTVNDGLRKKMMTINNSISPLIEEVLATISDEVDTFYRRSVLVLVFIFLVQFIIAMYLAISFSKIARDSIQSIKNGISSLSDGEFPVKITPSSEDEIGQTTIAFNNLLDRLRTAADFSEKIGNWELDLKYDKRYDNDVIALSLQKMQNLLISFDKEEKEQNWTRNGLALIDEILRNSNKNMLDLGDQLLSCLVKYVNANQAGLFVLNESDLNDIHLELISSYAWGKKKFREKRVDIGDGLVGQTWIEKEYIHLKEIPEDYITISSGLGDASPKTIFLTPLIVQEEFVGIIEIASFHEFDQNTIDFILKVSENIASTFASERINERTKILLEQSRSQTEEMRVKEEEMRQNLEEMAAIQEEVARKEEALNSYIAKANLGELNI